MSNKTGYIGSYHDCLGSIQCLYICTTVKAIDVSCFIGHPVFQHRSDSYICGINLNLLAEESTPFGFYTYKCLCPGLRYPAKIDVSVPWNMACGPTEAEDAAILADIAANKPPVL